METTTPVTDHRNRKKFYVTDTHQRRMLVKIGRALFRLLMEMEVTGLEYFPRQGPVIVVANHVSDFDVFPMQLAVPRPIFSMGRVELFQNPFLDLLMRSLGAFPASRGGKDPWAMQHAARVLNHGQILGIFPEGTRSRDRGLAVAKTGTARLAIEAQCPILPMTVMGSDRLLAGFPRRAQVQIKLLPALHPRPGETPLALTDRIMFTLAQALPPYMRGVYAELPKGFQVNA